jgi:hypothetical protein
MQDQYLSYPPLFQFMGVHGFRCNIRVTDRGSIPLTSTNNFQTASSFNGEASGFYPDEQGSIPWGPTNLNNNTWYSSEAEQSVDN